MSLTIDNFSFFIFGNGFDGVRNDSGDGMVSFMWKCDYAAFDASGQYLWVVTKNGAAEDRKIRKLDTSTWVEVPHAFENVDVSDSNNNVGKLAYVENDNSNLGVLVIDTTHLVVFDLTTDNIVATVSGNLGSMTKDYALRAVKDGDIIRIVGTTMNQSNYIAPFAVIDIDSQTYASNTQSGGYTISGFYNDTDIVLVNRNYGDRQAIWGATIGTDSILYQTWWKDQLFTNVTLESFASNDKLFFPTNVADVWQYGEYNIPPDITTPSPITTFGMDANTIATPACYTRGRTWAAFRTTNNALVVSDMSASGILYTGDSPSLTPMAMGDDLIVCAGSDGYTYLAKYR